MNERENSILRMNANEKSLKTYTQLASARRKDLVMQNTSKFGEQTIGIHGQELPKYSENQESKQYW